MSCCCVGLMWEGMLELVDSAVTCAEITEESFPIETFLMPLP